MARRFLIIFLSICLLLVSIVFLPSFIRNPLLSDKNESSLPSDVKEGFTLFIIHNKGNTNHEVTVKVSDAKNISIFNESYILAPGEDISVESSVILTTGTCIAVTLDNSITETETTLVDFDIAVIYVDIYPKPDDPLDLSISVP